MMFGDGEVYMFGLFGRRAPTARTGVERILVTQAAHASPDQTRIVSDAVEFVNSMQQRGLYLRSELPPNALRAYHADYYLAQVANGGHGQFVGNSGWVPVIVQDITEALAAMKAEPYAGIFMDLCKLIDSDKVRAQKIADGRGFGDIDPAIKALDDRFFKHDVYKTFSPIIARWLRGLPELEVVPDTAYQDRIKALCESNPQRAARLAVREEATLNASLTDPLHVAARLLCVKGNCLPMLGIGGGDPSATTPDGRQATAWQIQTGQGRKALFILEDVALLCETYLDDGRKLTNELMDEIRQKIAAGNVDLDAFNGFANKTQREVARIPAADISSAIEAAKSLPVVLIAQLLCAKLGTNEPLRQVYAAVHHNSGQWLWLIEMDSRAGIFGNSENDILLSDVRTNQPLARVSAREVREAMARQTAGRA